MACTGGAQQTGIDLSQDAAAALQRNISASDLALLKQGCADASPSLTVAAAGSAPRMLSAVATYPAAFCRDILAGTVPATANTSSVGWLTKTLVYVDDAAKVAGYVLPAALKLIPLVAAGM